MLPRRPGGTLADRLAYATFTQLITGTDALIDAHCGDLLEALEPFALYEAGPSEDRALALAVAYGLRLRHQAGSRTGPRGRRERRARRRPQAGIPAITAEAGGCGLVEQDAVDLHVAGLNRVLTALGMLGDGRQAPARRGGRGAGAGPGRPGRSC